MRARSCTSPTSLVFIASSSFTAFPIRRSRTARISPNRVRMHPLICVYCCRRNCNSNVTVQASAEEEVFIRRAAVERARVRVHTRPRKGDTVPSPVEEDFFVADSARAHTAAAAVAGEKLGSSAPSADGEASIDLAPDSLVSGDDATSAAQMRAPGNSAAKEKVQSRRIGVPAREGLRLFGEGARREAVRFISESPITAQLRVRIPTGRETAMLAWEALLVAALVALLRAGVSSTLRWIHNRLSAKATGEAATVPYEQSVFECMQRPLEFVSIFTVATALAEAVSRPLAATGLLRYIRTLRELGFIFCCTWFLLRWIDRIRSRFLVDKRIDKAQVDATSRIATVVTTLISILISLDTVGINVQTVLAFGGIGGVAIGFAGREIISNFFGGFMIFVTRPFTVGEWIRSIEEAELNGTVEDIGWYLTRVRTWDKRPLYIPNSRFSTLIVENGSRMMNRRILHTLNLRHEDTTSLPQIVAALNAMLMSNTELDPRQHRMAYVDSFGEYSVRVWLSCYTKSVFLYDYRRVQQEILLRAYDIIREHGCRLATATTRDVRPGVDTDRYGPRGSQASFGHADPGPKYRSNGTHRPQQTPARASTSGKPVLGIPFFTTTHAAADEGFINIESGIPIETAGGYADDGAPHTEHSERRHFRTQDDPVVTPDRAPSPATTAASGTAASASKAGTQQTTGTGQTNNSTSTSQAAVVAAAAALSAAGRNAARNAAATGTDKRSVAKEVGNDATTGKDALQGRTGTPQTQQRQPQQQQPQAPQPQSQAQPAPQSGQMKISRASATGSSGTSSSSSSTSSSSQSMSTSTGATAPSASGAKVNASSGSGPSSGSTANVSGNVKSGTAGTSVPVAASSGGGGGGKESVAKSAENVQEAGNGTGNGTTSSSNNVGVTGAFVPALAPAPTSGSPPATPPASAPTSNTAGSGTMKISAVRKPRSSNTSSTSGSGSGNPGRKNEQTQAQASSHEDKSGKDAPRDSAKDTDGPRSSRQSNGK